MDGKVEMAAEARRVCSKALLKLGTGQQAAAEKLLEDFCAKCWGIVQGDAMAAEVADLHADRMDLATLRVDLASTAPEQEQN